MRYEVGNRGLQYPCRIHYIQILSTIQTRMYRTDSLLQMDPKFTLLHGCDVEMLELVFVFLCHLSARVLHNIRQLERDFNKVVPFARPRTIQN